MDEVQKTDRALARKHGVKIQIHVSEVQWEVQQSVAETGMTPLCYLDSIGFLSAPSIVPVHNPVSSVVYCAKACDVETVIINGTVVMDRHRIVTMDDRRAVADAVATVWRPVRGRWWRCWNERHGMALG